MIIAVDFDGTIVEHRYPRIGEEIPFAVDTLKLLQQEKHRLILWSVREGSLLDEAVEWCKARGLEFYAVNKDYPEEQKRPPRLLPKAESRHVYRRPQFGRTAGLGSYL